MSSKHNKIKLGKCYQAIWELTVAFRPVGLSRPVWSHEGIVCIANAFKDKVKLTFYEGASIADPDKFYNNGLEGKKWRTIDYFKDDKIKEQELTDLVRSAVACNLTKKSANRK